MVGQLLPAAAAACSLQQQQQLALLAASGRLASQTTPTSLSAAACLSNLGSGAATTDPSLQAAAALLCGNGSGASFLNSGQPSTADLAQMAAIVSASQLLPSAQQYSALVQSVNQAPVVATSELSADQTPGSMKIRSASLSQTQRMHPYLR
ncbi:hypothetical protein Ciccas_002639 [Cichlidogyrus casuarinus]|uniref:Uncharacterized protein n=1 Tax=Cichlidogyrus casuarinus TaxID=1844966 RepID=A0ABD2QIX3_9PLAT